MKKKLLVVSKSQFGYHTDTFKYCEYCMEKFKITYIGWDYNREKINLDGIEVIYVSRKGNLLLRNKRLLSRINSEVRKGFSVIFIDYIRGISILKLLNPRDIFIFDVRTLRISQVWAKRISYNLFLKFESFFFDYKTIISDGLAKQIGFKSYHLLPLGGDCFTMPSKNLKTESIDLLYVGTLSNRNILECVKGFHQFVSRHPNQVIHFTIIGDSPFNELNELKAYVLENGLQEYFTFPGRLHQKLLSPYFENADIGISFVPCTRYFDFQPPTKTFEYLLSGIPVIATATYENKKIIDELNGIIIDDNAYSFSNGLEYMIANFKRYNSSIIKENSKDFNWLNVVNNNLVPYVKNLTK